MKFRIFCSSNCCDSFDEYFEAFSQEEAEDYFLDMFEEYEIERTEDGLLEAYTSNDEGNYWRYSLACLG